MQLPQVNGSYRKNYKLAQVTWFRVGGDAEYLFKPYDLADLIYFLKNRSHDLKVYVLGVGSNLIVRDGGIFGIVIKLGKNFSQITLNNDKLEVGAGCLDYNVSQFCLNNSIKGLEFLSGIPGTIGGAIAMNAGAYGSEVADFIIQVEAVDLKGNIYQFNKEECGFSYRKNSLAKDLIFTKVIFNAEAGNPIEIRERIDFIALSRASTQPIKSRTGGSTFKNPKDHKAWQLIDQAGCRGMKYNQAIVSPLHCNFLINQGLCLAEDLEILGEMVRERVKQHSGIMLEWEIKIIGDKR